MTLVLADIRQFVLLFHLKPHTSARIFVKTWFQSIIKRLFLVHSRILSSCPVTKKKLELWIFVNTFLHGTAVPHDSKTTNYTRHNIIYLRSDLFLFTNHFQEWKTLYGSYSRPLHVEIRKRQLGIYKIIRPIQVNSVTRYMQDVYK